MIDGEIAKLTNGTITTAGQVAKIQAFIRERGHPLESLTKHNVDTILTNNPSDEVRRLLELRRDGSRASVRKISSLLAGADDDDRLRGTLRFHGAATGRWSGSRFQPQNLKKPETKDIGAAVDAILAGDMPRLRTLGAPLKIVGDVSRAMICAAPDHILIGGDFSAIEIEGVGLDRGRRMEARNVSPLRHQRRSFIRTILRHCHARVEAPGDAK